MLGRYIAVTLVVLGGAMLIAPDSSDRQRGAPSAPEVARSAAPATTPAATSIDSETTQRTVDAFAEAGLGATDTDSQAEVVQASLVVDEPASLELNLPAQGEFGATATGASTPLSVPTLEDPNSLLNLPATDATLALIEASEADDGSDAVFESDEASSDTMYVTGTRVNVRSGPSTQYSVIGTVALGDAVQLMAYEGTSWAVIRLDGGARGYMASRFLSSDAQGG